MKQSKMSLVVLAVAILSLAGLSFAADVQSAKDGEKQDATKMKGGFVWERRDGGTSGDLEAVFTPTGEDSWDVTFYFDWEDEPREWSGTAKGSLNSGSLEGEAQEDRDRKRTFKFMGQVDAGVFKGEHGAVRDGELSKRGTLELTAQ